MVTGDHPNESRDLELHAALCAERYKEVERRLDRFEFRLDKIEDGLSDIKTVLNQAHKDEKKQLLNIAGTIIMVLLGIVGYLFTHLPK